MQGSATRVSGREYPRYVCSGALYGASAPDHRCTFSASSGDVDAQVEHAVAELLGRLHDPALLADVRARFAALRQTKPAVDPREKARLTRTIAKASDEITTATRMLVKGSISEEAYATTITQIQRERQAAVDALAQITRDEARTPLAESFGQLMARVGGWRGAWEQAEVATRRAVLAALIDRVTPFKVARGAYTADIQWTPAGEAHRQLAGTGVAAQA